MSWSDRARVLALLLPVPVLMGTVAEQRARLPPPAECTDPLAGTWKSHQYHAEQRQWTECFLHIRRLEGKPNQLEGQIVNHSWHGDDTLVEPPPCSGDYRYRVSMDAKGTVEGDHIEFWGLPPWRKDAVLCGQMYFGYNLDHFSGDIDHELHEFQSVNNDGGVAVNQPTVFRRIRCVVDHLEPVDPIEPPPYLPPTSSGCGPW